MARCFQEPAVSMAIAVKMWMVVRPAYVAVIQFVALLAADAAWAEEASKCESEVSGMVTSHATGSPRYHGSSIIQSCLLL